LFFAIYGISEESKMLVEPRPGFMTSLGVAFPVIGEATTEGIALG
jgi:hypothetical protein